MWAVLLITAVVLTLPTRRVWLSLHRQSLALERLLLVHNLDPFRLQQDSERMIRGRRTSAPFLLWTMLLPLRSERYIDSPRKVVREICDAHGPEIDRSLKLQFWWIAINILWMLWLAAAVPVTYFRLTVIGLLAFCGIAEVFARNGLCRTAQKVAAFHAERAGD